MHTSVFCIKRDCTSRWLFHVLYAKILCAESFNGELVFDKNFPDLHIPFYMECLMLFNAKGIRRVWNAAAKTKVSAVTFYMRVFDVTVKYDHFYPMLPISVQQHFKRCISFYFISSDSSVTLITSPTHCLVLWLWTMHVPSTPPPTPPHSLSLCCSVCYAACLSVSGFGPVTVSVFSVTWTFCCLYHANNRSANRLNCGFVLSTSAQEPDLLKWLAEKCDWVRCIS